MANATDYALQELNKETTIGGVGTEVQREIPRIDLTNFAERKDDITDELWDAATQIGFFQLTGHGVPLPLIDEAFAMSKSFFALPHDVKGQYPMQRGTNSGWEYKAQVRPSTGTADQKESYQITTSRMEELKLWPTSAELPGFKASMLAFERANWHLATKVLGCFATKLGMETDFFTVAHDPMQPTYQSTVRLIHYLAMKDAKQEDFKYWRAGAHSDYNCLTLLHQRTGQGGLQVAPGKDDVEGLAWTEVVPEDGIITCNIGDMLMRWSDDVLKSTLHRVRMPKPCEYDGPRYSIAFFAQANKDAMIVGPKNKYEPMSAGDYMQMRLSANFDKKAS
ncbi:MAG: 2-oxoglutarate and iron-dependent oxygenase domain-containing protein [Pseudomonadota bacterium]